ncbi:MAG: serine hydrolase [Clostridiales bacterium]|nr:serine hydrolase [Clostridiales bacterium]
MNTNELKDLIEKTQPNICQIVVLKDGREVFSGEWNGYKRDDCTHIMSATKSVVSLLTGIAVDKGLIKSIDDKVLDYFPDYQVKRGEKTIQQVTIRHLLTMRAPYKGKGDPWSKVCASEDWTKTSLDFLGGKKGLTDEFSYRTVCLHILSGILYQASKMKTVDFANEFLFGPLGIRKHENFYAKSAGEHKAFTIEKTPKGHVWFADRDGLGTPGYGLCMSAEDMAKIGQMCLGGGEYEGRRIVSEKWIHDMTVPRKVEGPYFRGMQYGYLWWVIHPEKNIYAAIGNSGNVIYVNPEKNTVVAVASYFKPTVFDRVDFIEDVLLPAL